MNSRTRFDTGPLSWVKGEIDAALARALEALRAYAADTGDAEPLALARAQLHQAQGALAIVGLEGVTRLVEELEALLADFEREETLRGAAMFALGERGFAAVHAYLDQLSSGAEDQPLRLFGLYADLVEARGKGKPDPVDLFYPDLSLRPPQRDQPVAALRRDEEARYLQEQRARFQRGMLNWLRQDPLGVGDMRAAVEATEAVQRGAAQRAFWWVASAFLDALERDLLPAEVDCKRMCGRIEQQLRRLTEGSAAVAERMLREVLYCVARARPGSPQAQLVQDAWGLKRLLPEEQGAAAPLAPAPAATKEALEALARSKSAWNEFAAGTASSLAAFQAAAAALSGASGSLGNGDLTALAREIAGLADWLATEPAKMSEAIALEVATALLLAENALGGPGALGDDFAPQSQFMRGRLQACVQGNLLRTAPPIPALDEMSRKAQERLVMSQLVAEMQANLKQVEQVLDAFFRDSARRAEVAELAQPVNQVKGALQLLGESRARATLEDCDAQIRRMAQPDNVAGQEDFERLAQMLSGLGFYVEALARGEADFDEAMRPIAPGPAEPEPVGPIEQIAPAAATPAPSEQTEKLIEAGAQAIDAEMLAVYLEEAEEVLAAIREHLDALEENREDREALLVVRRGFHTLKGSGRMVGLTRLGEAAWAVEKVLNAWLDQRRTVNTALLQLIGAGHGYFCANVARLKSGETATDERALVEDAERTARGEAPDGAQAAAQAAVALAAPGEEELVRFGERELSRAVLNTFIGEAKGLLAALAGEREILIAHGVVTDAMMRAVHTLAGICGTVGAHAARDLGRALERALAALGAGTLSESEESLAGRALEALEAMVASIGALQQPTPRADLIGSLDRIAPMPAPAGAIALESPGEAVERAPDWRRERTLAGDAASVPERKPRRLDDDLDPQVLPAFLEEASELVPAVAAGLRDWRASPREAALGQALARLLHTLKGSARMAGAMALGELTHHMETRVAGALALEAPPSAWFDGMEASLDRMSQLHERLQRAQQGSSPREAAAAQPPAAAAAEAGGAGGREAPLPRALLRVRAEALDRLVNEAGEVAIARGRIEGEMRALKGAMRELSANVERLRSQLREIEIQAESQMQSRLKDAQGANQTFDPLELDRFTRFQELARLMTESVGDVQTVHQHLAAAVDGTDAALAAQARLNRDLQHGLMRVRMVAFSNLAERLHRIVRQSAREYGRMAKLDIRGAQVELDRSVLERMTPAFEHMIRNAVAHGIEPAPERAAKGKPEAGTVRIEVAQEGNDVAFTVADDGRGLDMPAIRAKALASGLVREGAALPEAEIADFIFLPGFSTAAEVTRVAGRGVGMDVVRTEVASLGGRIELGFERGRGTRFTVHLPLTLAVTRALLARAGARTYAIPAVMVEHVAQFKADALAAASAAGYCAWQGRRYPLHYLPRLLEVPAAGSEPSRYVLFLRSGASAVALHVDALHGAGSQEIVVKAIGPQLQRVAGVIGATVLGSGEIALIVDPASLLAQRALRLARAGAPAPAREPQPPARPSVMVVDDSLTVRKVTGRLLARAGYEVVAAKDGVEAMEKLRERVPDLMLVDIEMPRMDGFDLTRNVRSDERLAQIPIIIITSRSADKHRNYAREIGVNVLLGKPFQESELLGHISGLLEARAGR
ncbi:MAG: Hpt domain-containing protein [Betaproteobacteria bacterium]|nr:Hpt domain-containing protein [Betaproteobacteria bacterium]